MTLRNPARRQTTKAYRERRPTDRQIQVLEFIRVFIQKNQYPPSTRDICDRFRINLNGVTGHLIALEKHGLIKTTAGIARSIRIVEGA